MSKRLIRIKPAELLATKNQWQRYPLNAVLADGNTLFGRLVSLDSESLTLKDTRDHSHQIRINDLYELVYDHPQGYPGGQKPQ